MKKSLKEVSLGLKGVKSVSKKKKRFDDWGPSHSAEGLPSTDPLEDPAWICVRGPLLEAHKDRTGLLGTYSFESFWEDGSWDVSFNLPLMGYSHQRSQRRRISDWSIFGPSGIGI